MACNSCNSCNSGSCTNGIWFPDFVANSCCNPCCANTTGGCGCNRCSCGCGCGSSGYTTIGSSCGCSSST